MSDDPNNKLLDRFADLLLVKDDYKPEELTTRAENNEDEINQLKIKNLLALGLKEALDQVKKAVADQSALRTAQDQLIISISAYEGYGLSYLPKELLASTIYLPFDLILLPANFMKFVKDNNYCYFKSLETLDDNLFLKRHIKEFNEQKIAWLEEENLRIKNKIKAA
jgi:hypothetical protein